MDTRFSMAIHVLILIALSPEPMSSAQMAESVGTNASHVRRILGQLKRAGLVDGKQGAAGFRLLADPAEMDLRQIYCAVQSAEGCHAFDVHQNSSDRCVVGRHIQPVLHGMFAEVERQMEKTLADRTLQDCIQQLQRCVPTDE